MGGGRIEAWSSESWASSATKNELAGDFSEPKELLSAVKLTLLRETWLDTGAFCGKMGSGAGAVAAVAAVVVAVTVAGLVVAVAVVAVVGSALALSSKMLLKAALVLLLTEAVSA